MTDRAAGRPRPPAEPAADRTGFAQRLTSLMAERGISVTEAARRVRENLPEGTGFATANLSHYRSGRSVPRLPYLKALSLALGVDTGELLGSSAIVADLPSTKPVSAATILSQSDLSGAGAPSLDQGGCVMSQQDDPDEDRKRAADPEPISTERTKAASKNFLHVEDYGSEVRIQVDQRLPWDKALQILQVLKTHGEK